MRKLFTLALLAITMIAFAQQNPPLPIDPNVRTGRLENGLTYFIRHNNLPENRADFYIAQRVGSMQEEDHQMGLAHILEHTAFGGTKNFPGNLLLEYLQDNGIRFGQNINAYTSFDETVYFLTDIPTTNQNLMDSCLLILHDWSNSLSLLDEIIERERGVVREEWRTRGNAQMRLWEQLLPAMFPDSKYGNRLPIGSIDVIDNFTPDELRAYYQKWYRPDLQSIIIVGNIDVDEWEQKIKDLFSPIPLDPNRAERIFYPVADNDEPIVAIATDVEASTAQVLLFFKHDALPMEMKNTQMGFVYNYIMNAAASMMNQRLAEITQTPNAPFTFAQAYDDDYFIAKTKNAWTVFAGTAEDKIDDALGAMMRETERARQFGFTASEYEIARANILKRYEDAFNNRGTQRNSAYSQQYVSAFINRTPIAGTEFNYQFIQQIAPNIPVEAINATFQQLFNADGKNIVVSVMGPERDGLVYPTESELLAVLNAVKAEEIEPYAEQVIDEPLISTPPTAGTITAVTKDEVMDATVWTLSNGMTVVLKNTDFRDDQILMTASSVGGYSPFAVNDPINSRMMGSVMTLGGVGNFSATDLPKVLAGKTASASPTVGLISQGFSGSSSIKDFETMLQLVHLYFTAPRKDDDAFKSFIQRMEPQLRNQDANPTTAFSDAITNALYGDNPMMARLKVEDLKKIDYERVMKMYSQIFSNPGSFIFTFVGNVDEDSVRPVIEQYLASLPGQAVKGEFVNVPMGFIPGQTENIFRREMQIPKAATFIGRAGIVENSQKNNILMSLFSQILNLVYTEKVREDESGTYGVSARGSISRYPAGQTILQIFYDTNTEQVTHLNEIIINELNDIAANGPRETDFNRAREATLNSFAVNQRENGYWLGLLSTKYFYGEDNRSDYLNIVNSITSKDIQDFAKMFLEQGNAVKVVMLPTEE
ncbi:MAG: insulinase family protein [Dysgonamonadaceae bacterium]|jgi:zinc protease|nr:insulinase family protein [Dysgonamonadaceae bacterium]